MLMNTRYFQITPLVRDATFLEHNIVSKEDSSRRWVATQIIRSQLGFRNYDNPIEQHEIDDLEIHSDSGLSGHMFDDEFDSISGYKYWFDDSFSQEEQEFLIEAYEGATKAGVGGAWVAMGKHGWVLECDEILYFQCPIKIDLIDQDGKVIEEDVDPV